MKGFVYFIIAVIVLAEEQLEYLKVTFSESVEGSAASNTAESASRLGKVLKDNFDEAQQVYEHGAEAKYE